MDSREKIDLSGTWQIAFDPSNEGHSEGWIWDHWPQARSQPIQVPGIWNIQYPDAEGVGFYRTAFNVPGAWAGKAVLLRFEGAVYRSEVWINGFYVGSHEGGYTPFWFDVTALIRFGEESHLVVRIAALSKSKAIDGILLQQAPLSKQSWYYVYGGIWGPVTLEACPKVSSQSVSVDPNLRRELAQVELEIHNRRTACRQVDIHLKVFNPHGGLAFEQQSKVAAPPGVASYTYSLPLPRPTVWSCEQPHLYRLETMVIDEDGVTDHQATAFGMRDFTVQNGQFFLNGEPLFIRGVLLQPNYPVNLVNHPDREMMVREITLAKEAGFNLIRVHIQPAPPGYLDLTDELGMLIYAETSLAWIKDSPRLLDHGKREIQALIRRDRNHPSVVFWGIYNENPSASALNSEALVRYARALDPTRVIVDNSGGSLAIDQDFGWIDRATVTPAYEAQRERILDVHLYLGSPVSESIYDWLAALGTAAPSQALVDEEIGSLAVMQEFDRECRTYRGKVFVSELGYGGMSDLDETVARFGGREDLLDARELKTLRDSLHEGFQKRHLARVFGSIRNLYLEAQKLQAIGNTRQLEALLTNPRISGYVITQYNDVAWEFHAGLLDLWRNPKAAYEAALRINRPQVLILRARQATASPGDRVNVDLTLVIRTSLQTKGRVCVEVFDPSKNEVVGYEREVFLLPGSQPLESFPVKIEVPGTYRITARLRVDGQTLAETSETILALEPVDWSGFPITVRCLGQAPASSFWDIYQEHTASRNSGVGADPMIYLAPYPASLNEGQWDRLFESAENGGRVVIGALHPEDRLAIEAFTRHGYKLALDMGIGSWMGCYHWIPDSELFSGLPNQGLALKPYAEILPKYVFTELGGEVHAGSLRNTQSRREAPAMLWYSDIETIRFGKGDITLCQYRIFEKIDRNPLAGRLAKNLLQFAASPLSFKAI
jgi:hypothetical protein